MITIVSYHASRRSAPDRRGRRWTSHAIEDFVRDFLAPGEIVALCGAHLSKERILWGKIHAVDDMPECRNCVAIIARMEKEKE